MIITEKNRELVKAFAMIMRDIGVPQTTAEMITVILKNKKQMDDLVKFTEENPMATEAEIIEKAEEMYFQQKQ